MSQFENIEGSKRFTVFQSLIKDRTFVRLTLPSSDYESLTLITQMQDLDDDPIFEIDPPAGLLEEIARHKATALNFEFNSVDHVTHRFESNLRAVTSQSITLGFPQSLRRHQKRDNFRVRTFSDSYAIISIGDTDIRMDIENISLGGVYCYCPNSYKSFFEENLKLKDMDLFLTLRSECFTVPIQRIEVRRLEQKPKPKHCGVAFQFLKINREAQKRLVQQIYELQREFLQNRLRLTE